MTEYILYIAQEANFESRSLLIPVDKLPQHRKDQLDKLREFVVDLDADDLSVNNVIVINLVEKNFGSFSGYTAEDADLEKALICKDFTFFADPVIGLDPVDEEWYKHAYHGFAKGFDHIKNYLKYQKITRYKNKDIKIVDSFLILNTRNDQFKLIKS